MQFCINITHTLYASINILYIQWCVWDFMHGASMTHCEALHGPQPSSFIIDRPRYTQVRHNISKQLLLLKYFLGCLFFPFLFSCPWAPTVLDRDTKPTKVKLGQQKPALVHSRSAAISLQQNVLKSFFCKKTGICINCIHPSVLQLSNNKDKQNKQKSCLQLSVGTMRWKMF